MQDREVTRSNLETSVLWYYCAGSNMTAIISSTPQGGGGALSVCRALVLTLNPLRLTVVVPVVRDNLRLFYLENSQG